MRSHAFALALAVAWVGACAQPGPARAPAPEPRPPPAAEEPALRELEVTATAFTSHEAQTDAHPRLTASGERLRPGMRALAVSRDLERAGLTFGTEVQIEGHGEWVVLDRMAPRWRRKIDLYMGENEAAARRFGEREVTIRWETE